MNDRERVEPEWLTLEMVVAIHERQLKTFGGPPGTRDPGALESALGRPVNRRAYEEADHAQLAAAYAFGIARNDPFIDGNKRTALVAVVTFLGLNDIDFLVPEAEAASAVLGLAADGISEDSLARWIRDRLPSATD